MAAFDTDLDVDRLTGYLETVVGIEVADVEVMDGGLNVNAIVSTPDAGQAFVVRRRGALGDAYYINDLAREYAILERLQNEAIPTPEPVAFCDADSVLGAPFFVTTHLDGTVIPLGSDPRRDSSPPTPANCSRRASSIHSRPCTDSTPNGSPTSVTVGRP